MKIRSNSRRGNSVVLEVETDYAQFSEAVDRAMVAAGKNISLPGFRPGKAPKEMIEKAVNHGVVEAHAAQDLIAELYPKILDEVKLEPVDFPHVGIVQQKKGQPFIFKITVDVYPEVKLGKYKGLKVEKKAVRVTEEDLARVLGNVQNRFARIGPDGKKELLPLDDEFAKKVSRYGTLAELKQEVEEVMRRDRQAEAEADVKNKLVAAAAAEAKVDTPPGMIEREIDLMLDELKTSLAQSDLTLEDYLKGIKKEAKALRDEFRKAAEARVRGKVVLRAVARAEKMKLADKELEEEFKKIAASTGEKLADLKKRLQKEGRKHIEDYLLRQKALGFILEKARIKLLD